MLKYLLLAGVCLMGTAWAADVDTAPVLTGFKECNLPRPDGAEHASLGMHITAEGKVEGAKVVESSGDPKFDEAAVACVSSWTYRPATHNGQPVAHNVVFHFGSHREDTPEARKPFSALKRDIDRRCHKLFPVKAYDLKPGHNIVMLTVARLASGEVQFEVNQSAGDKADKQSVACVKALIASPDHADLPATFTHTFEVRWEPRN